MALMTTDKKWPVLGFIGTGAITSALVTGLCTRAQKYPYPIIVSPRNQEKALALKKAYPTRVTVAESFQQVADQSDWLVLAVLPEAGEEVCRSIRLRPDHKVINLLSDRSLPEVKSWIGETQVLVHMVPLTFNAITNGPIVLHPPQAEAAEIFGHIGTIIQIEERYHAAVLAAITGYVAPFFTLMDKIVDWAQKEGVPSNLAADYVTAFFHATCEEALSFDRQGLHSLAEETTPGGINYMVKDAIEKQKGFTAWVKAMEPAIARLAKNIPR